MSRVSPTDLVDQAQHWLEIKTLATRATKPFEAAAVRRNDLCRLARALNEPPRPRQRFDLHTDLAPIAPEALNPTGVTHAVAVLREHYSPSTVHSSVSAWRQFCAWLVRQGVLETNPFSEVRVGRPALSTLPAEKHFSVTEIEALRTAASAPSSRARSAWPARDLAVLELLIGCGPRATELVSLQVRDVDRAGERPMLRLHRGTKGSKPRDVPIPRRSEAAVVAYLAERAERATHTTGYRFNENSVLFVRHYTYQGAEVIGPFDRVALYYLVTRLCHQAGVAMKPDAVVHALRHSYGVELARRGVPVFMLQQLMGHADPATTSGYTRFAGTMLVDALDDAGWL